MLLLLLYIPNQPFLYPTKHISSLQKLRGWGERGMGMLFNPDLVSPCLDGKVLRMDSGDSRSTL